MNIKLIKAITNVYEDYKTIEYDDDLRKRKLTLSDYNAIPTLIKELNEQKHAKTFISSVADYFKRNGFDVIMGSDGINYKIYVEGCE